uniref:Uncharacterized protein n=1 Tax=Lygus hesperus TaxID=30085 RepID=A0A146KUW6_LYGHE
MKYAVGILLAAAFVGAAVGVTDPCADAVLDMESGNYKNPESGVGLLGPWHCMSYYECAYDPKSQTAKATKKDCWVLLPLRQYDPISRECQWFWKAHCRASNPSPPTPAPTSSPAPTTTAPTTAASTTPAPTTAATTTPTTPKA